VILVLARGALCFIHGFFVFLLKKVLEVEDDDVAARHWLPLGLKCACPIESGAQILKPLSCTSFQSRT
jgi:hypothetical protein